MTGRPPRMNRDRQASGRPLPNRDAAIRRRSPVPVDSAVYQAAIRKDRDDPDEDRADLAAVRRALQEGGRPRPWAQVKADLGLSRRSPRKKKPR